MVALAHRQAILTLDESAYSPNGAGAGDSGFGGLPGGFHLLEGG
jgi:hypothetical protein